MTDVFFCSLEDSDDLRIGFAEACEARWSRVDGATVYQLSDRLADCSPVGFQRMRRIIADEYAKGDIYIVADDDVLLPVDFDLDECLRIFKAHPNFATLSLMPSNCTISEWTPEGYITENTPDVMEHVSAGHIRFCRKGHMKSWPMMRPNYPGYDIVHAEAIREAGMRVGYFRNHKALHLGEGWSQVWSKEVVAP